MPHSPEPTAYPTQLGFAKQAPLRPASAGILVSNERIQQSLDRHGYLGWASSAVGFGVIVVLMIVVIILFFYLNYVKGTCVNRDACARAVDFNVIPGSTATPLSNCQNANLSCTFGAIDLDHAIKICNDNACRRFSYDSGSRTVQLLEPTSKVVGSTRTDLYYHQ